MVLIKYEDIPWEVGCFRPSKELLVPLGYLDDVKWLPLNENILIIGGSEIGRTSFLRTIVFHAISQYSPESLLLWLYDAGLCTFKDFSDYQIPHVMLDGADETVESVITLIDALEREITIRQTQLFDKTKCTSFADCFKKTGMSLAPQGIVILNFAETFFRRFRELPCEYAGKFSRIVRDSSTLNICIIMCIQDYADVHWVYEINETHFPCKVAITRTSCANEPMPTSPVTLLSSDYPLLRLSPIWLSQGMLQYRLGNIFPHK